MWMVVYVGVITGHLVQVDSKVFEGSPAYFSSLATCETTLSRQLKADHNRTLSQSGFDDRLYLKRKNQGAENFWVCIKIPPAGETNG